MPKEAGDTEEHVVFSCHLIRYLNPMTQHMSIFAMQLGDEMPPQSECSPHCDINEERIYATYVCDAEGNLVKKLLFFESDYRKALQHEFQRRALASQLKTDEGEHA
ncbi:hypothetical protein KR093_001818 [Drosophila rubida]|uniref:Uncharacterized protein n=1 Tax=Drosophila rubida TaxID=30044 RepID=A0AAD4KBY8_9MUSC|nr:hypothetical protein KR093_001818 [Drosophila rubida]